MYIAGTDIPLEWKVEMTRYLENHVNDDGGWGLHLIGPTTVFATALYYVVLRILGMDPANSLATGAREKLLALGKCHRESPHNALSVFMPMRLVQFD